MPEIILIPDIMSLSIQLISLIILFVVFKRFAWAPTKAFLKKRQDIVQAQFDEAEAANTEAQQILNEYQGRMNLVEVESEELIETAKEEGRIAYHEIQVSARRAAEQKMEKMDIALAQDRANAMAELKSEMVDMAVLGAQQIILKEIDEEAHKNLFENFLEKVGEQID